MTVDGLDDVHVLFGKTRNQIQTHLFGDGRRERSGVSGRFQNAVHVHVCSERIVGGQEVCHAAVVNHVGEIFHGHDHVLISGFVGNQISVKEIRTGIKLNAAVLTDKRVLVDIGGFVTFRDNVRSRGNFSGNFRSFKRTAAGKHDGSRIGGGHNIEIHGRCRADLTVVVKCCTVFNFNEVSAAGRGAVCGIGIRIVAGRNSRIIRGNGYAVQNNVAGVGNRAAAAGGIHADGRTAC